MLEYGLGADASSVAPVGAERAGISAVVRLECPS